MPELAAGREQHRVWRVMLLVCWLHEPGRWSADHLWCRYRFRRDRQGSAD